MGDKKSAYRAVRWILAGLILAAGGTAAWGLGGAPDTPPVRTATGSEPQPAMLYGAWAPAEGARTVLFRSSDHGETWQPVPLRSGIASVAVWASDGADRVAVALSDGTVLRSGSQGERWSTMGTGLDVLSLAWGENGLLWIGTDGRGLWQQSGGDEPVPLAGVEKDLASASVHQLALAGGRLFAAAREAVYVSDDGGKTFHSARGVPGRVSALAALDADTILVGTEGSGILRSRDAGRSWQPASQGLGQAAGLVLSISALRADPAEPGVLYAGLSYLVGGTQLHESAAGLFVTVDEGSSWLRLAGPQFPEARRASGVVLVPSRPLTALAATPEGLQGYRPDLAVALDALKGGTARERANAARLLGLARAAGSGDSLVAALGDPDSGVALAAADALGRLSDPSTLPALKAALAGASPQVRSAAARALGLMRTDSAVEPLAALLEENQPATAGAAAEALRQIGTPSALQALLAALADSSLTTRRHAAQASLEELGEPAVAPLSLLLSGPDATMRSNAAETLGWIGSSGAAEALIAALGDESDEVRSQAAWALGEIGAPKAQRSLTRARTSDPSATVREAATLALGRLSTQPAAQPGLWSSVTSGLAGLAAVRWLLLGLAVAAAGLLAARNLRPSPVRVARRTHRHYR